jgi:hypothetical protein
MRVHPEAKIKEMKRQRRFGKSIPELVNMFGIPKTTVWHHVHGIEVLPQFRETLKSKRGGNRMRKQKNWQQAREKARELLSGPERELAVIIAMLYWCEGNKKSGFSFINSDGAMIKCYLKILRNVLNISEDLIKPEMRVYSGMDTIACLDFWSSVTEIPKEKIVVRFNDGGTSGRTKYGMCRISIKKPNMYSKLIHQLIDEVAKDVIKKDNFNKSPRSSMD